METTPQGPCRQCGAPKPTGFTVTCGKSHCQESEFHDNKRRAKRRR